MHHLTTFYVLMSLGSFLGSLVIGWLLPLTTDLLLEVPFALALAVAALTLAGEARPGFASAKARSGASEPVRPAMKAWHIAAAILTVVAALTAVPWAAHGLGLPLEPCIALVALPLMLAMRGARLRPALLVAQLAVFMALIPLTEPLALGATAVKYHRNYYGIYKIFTQDGLRYLQHGSTQHGRQFIEGPRRATPQSYYHPSTPIGEFLTEPGWAFEDIAMVGLGSGAIAAYMGEGQRLTVLELDPDNLGIAEREFGYLAQAREAGAALEFVFGDGRISLAAMPAASCDLLVIDAFSSGAIPVHMLTVEALEQYFRVLRPDGVLLMHISNKYLSLKPLVASLAGAQGVSAYYRTNLGSVHENADLTYWMALTRDDARQAVLDRRLDWTPVDTAAEGLPRPWTDHYSNLPGLWFRK
jgi:SAM-dependent methyltransferase